MTAPFSSSVTSDGHTASHLPPPAWVVELLRDGRQRMSAGAGALEVQTSESDDFCLVSIRLPGAGQLPSGEFESASAGVYRTIRKELQGGSARHPVRIWNHLPAIHAPGNDGTDRYMSFNAGRFRGYTEWFGGTSAFERELPSASAVGHDGADLVVYALGARSPGVAIANPRQVAPYHYSRRFGPLPPCFARATVLPAGAGHARRILVGGTASIRGEDSIHLHDVAQQTAETFDNLAHLVRAASGSSAVNGMSQADVAGWLKLFRDVRIYYVRPADRPFIDSRSRAVFSDSCRIELLRADLCRSELLVEIEGQAVG